MKLPIGIIILELGTVLALAQQPTPTPDPQAAAAEKVLRDVMRQLDRNPRTVITNPPPPRVPSFPEMEQMYLSGKITAKQFQMYLQQLKVDPRAGVSGSGPNVRAPAAASEGANSSAPTTNPALNELEAKMDQLIRAKEARDKAALNKGQAGSTNAPAVPVLKTKRDRLNDLLRQLVEGKISDEDYRAQREKIMAEPESTDR